MTSKLATGLLLFCRVKKASESISSYVISMNFSDQLTDEDKLKLLGNRVEAAASQRALSANAIIPNVSSTPSSSSTASASSTMTTTTTLPAAFLETGVASIQDLVDFRAAASSSSASKDSWTTALIREAVAQADKVYALEKLQLHHEEELKHLKASFDEELEASKATFLCNREESAKLEVKKLQEKFDLETDLLSEKVRSVEMDGRGRRR